MDDLSLPHDLVKKTTELGTFPQTITLVSYLLDSFSPKATVQGLDKRQNLDLRQNLSGVLNGFIRIRKIIVKWLQGAGSNLDPGDEKVPSRFLTHVHRFCVSKSSASVLLSDVSLTTVWIQCLSDLLESSIIHQLSNLQIELSKFLDEVSWSMKQSRLFEQQSRELLLPALVDLDYQGPSSKPIETCLLVNIDSYPGKKKLT